MEKKEHEHNWMIFNDPNLANTGWLSFFCRGCLALKKIQKKYGDD